MKKAHVSLVAILGVAATALFATLPVAQEDPARAQARGLSERVAKNPQVTDRIIVRLREGVGPTEPSARTGRAMAMSANRARALSSVALTDLEPLRVMGDGAHVLKLGERARLSDVQAIAARLARDPSVEYAEPDVLRFPLQVPTDRFYLEQQWNLREALGGINVEAAWGRNARGQGVVVAVVDTGIIPTNRDLTLPSTRLVGGYDFISADPGGGVATANDGDGRDADPSDPGNWISSSEAGRFPFEQCPSAQASDWHGTHTAGIIAANANNDAVAGLVVDNSGLPKSVVGAAYLAQVQPLRALGKCGGYVSDIADAIRWAAGLAVSGTPANPVQRAPVINLSLGSTGSCTQTEQSAISAALAQPGVKAIVAAAGNEDGGDARNVSPANCPGVISVAATDRSGARAPYSNVGPGVTLSAPGGCFLSACPNAAVQGGILSTFNAGSTVPSTQDAYAYVIGTSEAAAHVSAVVALMLSANPNLTSAQVRSFLVGSARPFPNCTCSTSACGAGIVDADAAVRSAQASSVQASTGVGASCAGRASLAGSVFRDANANNVFDGVDVAAADVTIILTNNATGTEIARTTTNASGNFVFVSLAPGTYRLTKVQPTDGTGTTAIAGSSGGTAGPNAVSNIVLADNVFGAGYDFPLEAQTLGAGSGLSGGGGGGGGGCTIGGDGRIDPLLALVVLVAVAGIARRASRRR